MKYVVPSSRTVFTDLMVLLVSVLIGINSIMSFEDGKKETNLPPVDLPKASKPQGAGLSKAKPIYISIKAIKGQKAYFYNNQEVPLTLLIDLVKKSHLRTVVLRADRNVIFEWEEFCRLTSSLMQAGVKKISYSIQTKGG